MTTFHALTGFQRPRLHIWRDKPADAASQLAYTIDPIGRDPGTGLHRFEVRFDSRIHEEAHALLLGPGEGENGGDKWEQGRHAKDIKRGSDYVMPAELWFSEGATRALKEDPFSAAQNDVRIHVVTVDRYVDAKLMIWTPITGRRDVGRSGQEDTGIFFDVALTGNDQHWFLFKLIDVIGGEDKYEPDQANRLWCAQDGREVWIIPHATAVNTRKPEPKTLIVRFNQFEEPTMPELHIWQEGYLLGAGAKGTREADGWTRFEYSAYTEIPYNFLFWNPELPEAKRWEHQEATRNVYLDGDGAAWTVSGDSSKRRLGENGVWTLEGDHELFGQAPAPTKQVVLEIAARDPTSPAKDSLVLDVWVNRARQMLHAGVAPDAGGRWIFATYPEIVTSFRFRTDGVTERVDRHTIKVKSDDASPVLRYVVTERSDPLPKHPVSDLFADPTFAIWRPGAWIEDGFVRFAVYCPWASCLDVIGEFTDFEEKPLPMRSTLDGTYWWAQMPASDAITAVGRPSLHGARYKFRINQNMQVQDPAADWVENSNPASWSKLVDHAAYVWRNNSWGRPGWEYLTAYQLHPAWFAQRGGTSGLDGVARELTDPGGYLRRVNATALLLMPVCEFAGDKGWGYNPSFFYAVESSYGGPDALKRLVDEAHGRGFAVLVDVVFNHAGTSDNVLWTVASDSFFDGDTDWGAMINFDHPQVIHFFEQNLAHFMRQYRIDGFRFDFTRVIRYGGDGDAHIKIKGSGGGWDFMRRLQSVARGIDPGCIFMAEHLPNEWDLTGYWGVMDTQWNDNFHDRIVDASRGSEVMGELANAMKITHTEASRWHESTNYPESHDEVGNVPDRIVNVAGVGQGYRRNKVAAAATLLARGIPMWFMGAESGEWRQFSKDGAATLDLDFYERDVSAIRIRNWWNRLAELRRGNSRIEGPSPIRVKFAQDEMLAFTRGDGEDLFVLLNFGYRSDWHRLANLSLPYGDYKELLNSTWGDYRIDVEGETEHSNGGWDARLNGDSWLNVPSYGVVVLERW